MDSCLGAGSVGARVRGAQALSVAKSRRHSTAEGISSIGKDVDERFANALISTLDYRSSWKETRANEIAGAIFPYVTDSRGGAAQVCGTRLIVGPGTHGRRFVRCQAGAWHRT